MTAPRNSLSYLANLSIVARSLLYLAPVPCWAQIEEIVVTTRKREENLYTVPNAGLGVLAFHGRLPDPRVFGVRLNLRFWQAI